MKIFLKIIGALLAVIIVVVAIGFAWLYRDTHRTPHGAAEYVALGSSFAAGPGVGEQDPDSPYLCLRSTENYPHLLAAKRNLQLRDMTCSGATTKHILSGGQFLLGPQIDALDANTKLVTVTIGGNDISYMANLYQWSCRNGIEKMPLLLKGLCSRKADNALDEKLAALVISMHKIAEVVHAHSPQAQLIFVDYTTVLPEAGNCPQRLAIADDELDHARNMATQLRRVTAEIAQQSGAQLIRASEITRGHDICASEPWAFGWEFAPSTYGWGPMAYHPNAKAMTAIADAIDTQLNNERATK